MLTHIILVIDFVILVALTAMLFRVSKKRNLAEQRLAERDVDLREADEEIESLRADLRQYADFEFRWLEEMEQLRGELARSETRRAHAEASRDAAYKVNEMLVDTDLDKKSAFDNILTEVGVNGVVYRFTRDLDAPRPTTLPFERPTRLPDVITT